jgi:hypothetical protein
MTIKALRQAHYLGWWISALAARPPRRRRQSECFGPGTAPAGTWGGQVGSGANSEALHEQLLLGNLARSSAKAATLNARAFAAEIIAMLKRRTAQPAVRAEVA